MPSQTKRFKAVFLLKSSVMGDVLDAPYEYDHVEPEKFRYSSLEFLLVSRAVRFTQYEQSSETSEASPLRSSSLIFEYDTASS